MGLNDTDKVKAREPWGDGPIQRALADMARRHQLWLVGGTFAAGGPEPDKVYNSCVLYGPMARQRRAMTKSTLWLFWVGRALLRGGHHHPRQRDCRRYPLGRMGLSRVL